MILFGQKEVSLSLCSQSHEQVQVDSIFQSSRQDWEVAALSEFSTGDSFQHTALLLLVPAMAGLYLSQGCI